MAAAIALYFVMISTHKMCDRSTLMETGDVGTEPGGWGEAMTLRCWFVDLESTGGGRLKAGIGF